MKGHVVHTCFVFVAVCATDLALECRVVDAFEQARSL